MRVGNIFNSLMSIPKSFVFALHQVNMNLDAKRVLIFDAYTALEEEYYDNPTSI